MAGDSQNRDGEEILKSGARRSLRLAMTTFAGLLFVEGASHLGSDSLHLIMVPMAGSLVLAALRVAIDLDPRIERYADLMLLVPWAACMATILNHLPTEPLLALLFVSMTVVIVGASILPRLPFAIALSLTLVAQITCLYAMPQLPGSATLIAPLSAAAVAILIHVSRCREIQTADRNARLERAALEQQGRIDRLEHERAQARLETAVEERTVELEQSRHRFREQEKLAAIGSLAAGVAHQVNNPVGAILIAADYALVCHKETPGPIEHVKALDEIRQQAIRCGQIVKELLRYSRGSEGEHQPIALDECIESVFDATRTFAEENELLLSLKIGPGVLGLTVSGNRVELEEALVNLVRNAVEATAGLGKRIEVSAKRLEDWVEIRIEDDGPGIPPEAVSRLFEPFFTTRLNEGGSGLGLSLVHRILEDHSGHIEYEEVPEAGAAFRIQLPIIKEGSQLLP